MHIEWLMFVLPQCRCLKIPLYVSCQIMFPQPEVINTPRLSGLGAKASKTAMASGWDQVLCLPLIKLVPCGSCERTVE